MKCAVCEREMDVGMVGGGGVFGPVCWWCQHDFDNPGPAVLRGDGDPTVACVIPCYREDLERVRRTIESVRCIREINLIVLVDDGAHHHAELAQLEQVDDILRIVHLPENRGPAAAMNIGVGFLPDDAIVCRLDVGDVFLADGKAQQLRFHLETRQMPPFRASFTPHIDAVENRQFSPPARWSQRIYRDGVFCICTAVFSRSVWAEVGGFDESLRYGDDWDFAMRVQHQVGWWSMDMATCIAGAFPDGHTKRAERDPELRARKIADTQRVLERGQFLSHPDSMRHKRPS